MNLSVSVSDLDSYRRYRDHEEMSLAELMKKLRREEPPTEKMLAGTALHRVLETARDGAMTVAEANGHRFIFLLNEEIALTPIREMRGQRDYEVSTPSGENVIVTARGRVDSIAGTKVEDYKLSSQFDAERYFDAYQWRLYLSIFGAESFTYNVFVGKSTEGIVNDLREWKITEFHRLTLFHYPELDADIHRELSLYAEFALQHMRIAA